MSRLILHLSDLHFGRIAPTLPEALLAAARHIAPDLIVVSGDLTQRAKVVEFQQARAFLDQLPYPRLVVPGNHDVPLHNLYARFVHRLRRFQTHITADLEPVHEDPEMAVFGVNTARSATWKSGRLNPHQIDTLRARLAATSPDVARVIVTHHPFEVPSGFHPRELLGSARTALEQWTASGADLLLCGHLHVGDSTTTLHRYSHIGWHAIVVTAGTATSTRGRGAPNSFNVIRLEGRQSIAVAKWTWNEITGQFQELSAAHFVRTPAGWAPRHAGPTA
jgi:3',5'-cyclic AMP phosphodiesterase CpdA